jgi:hypothetical protein
MEERYSEPIKAIYPVRDELPVVAQVKFKDGRMETIKTTIKIKEIGEEIIQWSFFLDY